MADAPARARAPRLVIAANASVDVLMGPVAPWPRPGTEVLAAATALRPGGLLGNAGLALAGLGVPATLVWDVGDDAMGAWLRDELAAARSGGPRVLPLPTSLTVGITHPDGERTFFSSLGHLAGSDLAPLDRVVAAARPGDHLLIGGTFLLPRWRDPLPDLLARARAAGIVTALDTGWPTEGWSEAVREELRRALAHVDVFLPNLEEARGLLARPHATPEEALHALQELVAGVAIVKLGAAGAVYPTRGGAERAAAPVVAVRDTVGAGDTFDAALLAARLAGLPWRGAVTAALDVASFAISTSPRRYPPWRDVLDRAASVSASDSTG
jgi:sugar/nucleoside kinase (ribokinase family)